MTPPKEHMHLLSLVSAGNVPTITVGMPGTHGVVTGTHGMGVNTPSAAAVAAATVGLAIDVHMANGKMFTIGAKSMMVATGTPA